MLMRPLRGFGDVARRRFSTTIKDSEIASFSRLAADWWDPKGPMMSDDPEALHSLNAVRVPWVRDSLAGPSTSPLPLAGQRILDVGCGAGVLSEPLARLGADVKGLDASKDCLSAASAHRDAAEDVGRLVYALGTVEELAVSESGVYDAVVASEVAEHVSDLPLFLASCADLLRPGGKLFVTTLNRSLASRLLAITLAEDVLRLVPRGTHDYDRLVPPAQLRSQLEQLGLRPTLVHGLAYVPFLNRWAWIPSTAVNYAVEALKPL